MKLKESIHPSHASRINNINDNFVAAEKKKNENKSSAARAVRD